MVTVEGLFSPDGATLGDRIHRELSSSAWNAVKVAVAFAKISGVKHLYQALDRFGTTRPGAMSFSIGIDHGGSSIEAVAALNTLVKKNGGGLWVVHNPQGNPSPTFHPKVWLFSSENEQRLLLLGSGNLTQGGLRSNYEASLAVAAHATDQVITDAEMFFDHITDAQQPEVVLATDRVLQDLHDDGQLPSEGELRRITSATNSFRISNRSTKRHVPLFEGRKLPELRSMPVVPIPTSSITIRDSGSMAPQRTTQTKSRTSYAGSGVLPVPSATTPKSRFFFITVRMRQKTEVFLAKRPLDEDPAFFGAPFRGLTTPHSRGDPQPQADPLPIVSIRLHTNPLMRVDNHPLKMWTYTYGPSANGDFRTNFTAPIQKNIPDDSVVIFERDPVGSGHLQFAIDIFPPSHSDYAALRKTCNRPLVNSARYYGWA